MAAAKPRILVVHNTYFERGGEDSVVAQEIALLRKSGYEVFTCFFENEIFRKPGWKAPLLVANLFFNLSAYRRVYRLVKKEKIDFVHVHNFFYTASAAVFSAARSAGAGTLFTMHNYRLFCLNGFFFREGAVCMKCQEQHSFRPGIHNRCFKSSGLFSFLLASSVRFNGARRVWHSQIDRFLVINPLQAGLLTSMGIPEQKLFTRNNFLNSEMERQPVPYAHRQNFYLFVGRISEEKGIRNLIEAFRQIGQPLRIVGNGPMAEWVKQQTNEFISYHPAIPREEIFDWYASCKALVFPSIWPEGQPMVILEAQSTGALTIAARSAITEKMVGQQNGMLYEMTDSGHLANAVMAFEQLSVEEKQAMSETAYRYFCEHHTEERQKQVLAEIYPVSSTQRP